jgi:hypothetical protein
VTIDSTELPRLVSLITPSVGERAEKLLAAIVKANPDIGAVTYLMENNTTRDFWVAVSWSTHRNELTYLVREYLVRTKGWLIEVSAGPQHLHVQVSAAGYDHLESLRHGGGGDLDTGFCAMWFSNEVRSIWTDAIEPSIKAAGYKAIRIDGVEHNNKIDDEILSNIRRSRFVVADFTGERGGVYFEAGFALGLGRQVIWTVGEDALEKVHFDNRQYNFIVWKPDDLGEFAKRLRLRIEATVGRGPL